MSDEPKKTRAWIRWMGAVVLLTLLYPLSFGPAWRWALSASSTIEAGQRTRTLNTVYAPIYWLNDNFEWPGYAIGWYISKWEPD
jgi:hypothetical protein